MWFRGPLLTSLLLLVAGCGDPPVPTTATATAGATGSATVAAAVGTIPAVRITDAKGKGIKDLLVRWRVTSGNGRVVNDTVRTNKAGEASSGGWTLGTTAGRQTLEASVDGVSPAVFTAIAAPGPVVQLTRTSAESQRGVVNTAVVTRPSVRAEDTYGNPVPGVPVTFAVTLGTGSLTGAQQTTNDAGGATLGGWTLGTQAGQQLVRASAAGTDGAVFSVTAEAGPPVELVKVAGDEQQGVAGLPVPVTPGVRVVDAFANPVGNVPVTFTTGPSSGSVTSPTVATDPATGAAFVGSWTLGSAATQTLLASSTQVPGKTVTFAARAVQSLFDISVRFIGAPPSAVVSNAFQVAAARWRSVIVGDLHNTILRIGAGACATWVPALDETANDVVIFARIDSIDGPGQILGQARPCAINTATNLTTYGIMEFDAADVATLVANGSFGDVIVHEMGHVIGIGTLWNFRRTLLSGAGTPDPFFTGPAAQTQFIALNTVTYAGSPVPVENTGGGGTRDSHWRESVLGRELMTGFLNRNTANPLSRLSVGSLQDLGYVINLAGADAFSITAPVFGGFTHGTLPALHLGNDVMDGPLEEIARDGSRRRVLDRLRDGVGSGTKR